MLQSSEISRSVYSLTRGQGKKVVSVQFVVENGVEMAIIQTSTVWSDEPGVSDVESIRVPLSQWRAFKELINRL